MSITAIQDCYKRSSSLDSSCQGMEEIQTIDSVLLQLVDRLEQQDRILKAISIENPLNNEKELVNEVQSNEELEE